MCYKQKVRKENSLMGEDGGGGKVSGNIKLKNSCIGGTPQQELDFNWFFLQQNTHNYVLPRIHWFECNQGTSWIIFLSFHPSQQTEQCHVTCRGVTTHAHWSTCTRAIPILPNHSLFIPISTRLLREHFKRSNVVCIQKRALTKQENSDPSQFCNFWFSILILNILHHDGRITEGPIATSVFPTRTVSGLEFAKKFWKCEYHKFTSSPFSILWRFCLQDVL